MHDLKALGVRPDTHPEVRVRMGLKGRNGGVVEKDRFHLAMFKTPNSGQRAVSVAHPDFGLFNAPFTPKGEPPKQDDFTRREDYEYERDAFEATQARARLAHNAARRVLRGTLIHAQFEAPGRLGDGCIYTRFSAQKLPGVGENPRRRPACTGDGTTAQRWNGREFAEIRCDGDRCEFRQERMERGQAMTDCKRTSTLVFQLRWRSTDKIAAMPCARACIETGGMYSFATAQWWGFYQVIAQQWSLLGGQGSPDVFGLPIRLVLTETSVPQRGAKVWVPELHTDLPEGQTLQEFLVWRAQTLAQAGSLLTSDGSRLQIPDFTARDVVEADYEPVDVERPAP